MTDNSSWTPDRWTWTFTVRPEVVAGVEAFERITAMMMQEAANAAAADGRVLAGEPRLTIINLYRVQGTDGEELVSDPWEALTRGANLDAPDWLRYWYSWPPQYDATLTAPR